MSIREIWLKRVDDKELFKLGFAIRGRPEKRTLLLAPELDSLLSEPIEETEKSRRIQRLRADLENILAGENLIVCWEPYKARERHQIGRLDPTEDEVFDIRSVEPPPALRILFHFAEKDVLVAHLCNPRSISVSWLNRLPLINRKRWRRAIQDSNAKWSTLFPDHSPHSGATIDDYLSNAIILS